MEKVKKRTELGKLAKTIGNKVTTDQMRKNIYQIKQTFILNSVLYVV